MTATDLHPDTSEPRPGTCCGACPPIAGGGWDCTCPGMPGCPVNSPGLRTVRERDAVAQDLAQLAARLAAVEALAAKWDDLPCVCGYVVPNGNDDRTQCLSCASADLRAALAAPTDTTKEN